MTEIALSTSGLNKKFGSLVVAGDISLTLPRGARYALIGPNGAGKTTLINLLTGMLTPDGGKIMLGNDDITSLPPRRAREARAGSHLPDQHAVSEPVAAGSRHPRGLRAARRSRRVVEERAELPRCGRRSLRHSDDAAARRPVRAPDQGTGLWPAAPAGDRARTGIEAPRAAARRAAAGVPKEESGELFLAVANISSDISVLFIEHDMDVVFRFASRIIVMVSGRILVEGTPEEIMSNERVREVYLGSGHG